MATVQITLPDKLEERAREAGLLSDEAVETLLEDAMRRQAGQVLLDEMRRIHALNVPPMSMDEIDAEVKAYRAERRRDAGGS